MYYKKHLLSFVAVLSIALLSSVCVAQEAGATYWQDQAGALHLLARPVAVRPAWRPVRRLYRSVVVRRSYLSAPTTVAAVPVVRARRQSYCASCAGR